MNHETQKLIDDLRALDGPDREMDARVARRFGTQWGYRETVDLESRSVSVCQCVSSSVTASIDAAMALIPDGWQVFSMNSGPYSYVFTLANFNEDEFYHTASHKCAPIAILITAIMAMEVERNK